MRVLICGSRGWHDPNPITTLIAGLDVIADGRNEKLTVIHGDAPGADKLAGRIAESWGAEVIAEPADWDTHGKAAGPIRNRKMIVDHHPDVIYAFRSSGKSNGTDDMVGKGRAAGIPTYIVTSDA